MQAIDIETTALDPREGRVRLVQIRDGKAGRVYDAFNYDPRAALAALTEPVAHNAAFESAWIAHHFGITLPLPHDTMVMSQVLYTGTKAAYSKRFSHSLEAVARRELKTELDKEQQASDWSAPQLTFEQIDYAARDAHILIPLADTLMLKIERAGLQNMRVLLEEARRLSQNLAYHRRARLEARIGEALDEVDLHIEQLRSAKG